MHIARFMFSEHRVQSTEAELDVDVSQGSSSVVLEVLYSYPSIRLFMFRIHSQ